MLKIYITRHGQNVDNKDNILNGCRDYPLTDLGREQAKELAEKIKERGIYFNCIYSSPLIRALETAVIISGTLGGPKPISEDLLLERDFGIMTGKTKLEIQDLCAPDLYTAQGITYFTKPEGGETFPEAMDRAGKLLEKINSKHQDGNILLVCHGDIGKIIYAKYYNLDWKTGLSEFHFGNCDLVLLSGDVNDEHHVFKTQQFNT
jgi:broad specificity phosphatase PhoE